MRARLTVWFLSAMLAAGSAAAQNQPATGVAQVPGDWVEVRSPHFIVAGNAGEEAARDVAVHFEQIRAVFRAALPNARVDPPSPLIVLAAKDEGSLKQLLPAIWEQKDRARPTGVFVAGRQRDYVALRTDARGNHPYHTIYHEYVHVLTRLNFVHLPDWLNEGYAEFFGSTVIGDRDVRFGRPPQQELRVLEQRSLLPVERLFQVDHFSPEYNEADRASVFYAESWALVHYLMLSDLPRETKRLNEYVRLTAQGLDSVEAARQAFGDLSELEFHLRGYVRLKSFLQYRMDLPEWPHKETYTARSLSRAESATLLAGFHIQTGRTSDARELLNQAMRLDPNLAAPHEEVGLLDYQWDFRDDAAEHFARAIALGSRNYLVYYLHGVMALQKDQTREGLAEARRSLERATELNSRFAPAYSTLAGIYSMREGTMQLALTAARRAAELEPTEPHYALDEAYILLSMHRYDEAGRIGEAILAEATEPELRERAEAFLKELYQELHPSIEGERLDSPAVREASNGPGAAPSLRAAPTQTAAAEISGRISSVSCNPLPELDLTIGDGAGVKRLHAAYSFRIEFTAAKTTLPPRFDPCVHLTGCYAMIRYTSVAGHAYDGEIVAIEIRPGP